MSGTDESTTVTCRWFVKDSAKTESFPAKALKEAKSTNPREMSDEELQEIIEQGTKQTNETLSFTVGDIVVLKSGGPRMTIVSIAPPKRDLMLLTAEQRQQLRELLEACLVRNCATAPGLP
jgi:uncharacterized protein YodC (DUF2158 family)